MVEKIQRRVYHLLEQMPTEGLAAVKQLLCTELNYDRADLPLSQRGWPDRAQNVLTDPPRILARHESQFGDFDIIYATLSPEWHGRGFPLSLTAERLVINQLLNDHPYALFVFSDADEEYWHLVNVRYDEEASRRRVFRRISIGPDEQLRTASERLAIVDVRALDPDLFGVHPLELQKRHDDAFDVERVTSAFFQQYQQVFNALQDALYDQTRDRVWAHDFALQFLNRLMFLYYVQRKRWMGEDPDFVHHFWQSYRKANRPNDTFVDEWLNVLFFEAFNNRFQTGCSDRQQFPDDIRDALAMAPFLNGGLFQRNELDRAHSPRITDSRFEEVFEFLEGYNFTISEDTPLDQEVAVDPEMIGKVYESLVNVSEEADERGEAGIFYTPRVEIDLMCRLSLVNWLTNHLGEDSKNAVYEAVFALDPQDKKRADDALAEHNLWPRLDALLRTVTVVDPACGSGSFLVGMLYVLNDLLARAEERLGRQQSPYERKKRIIANSLYGVDVMEWAVGVAELRLWLQLVIDTELEPTELKGRPLLPNLSFKLRPGDSLVQEVGGMNLALRKGSGLIPPCLKSRIDRLKDEKRRFYNNDPECKYGSEEQLRRAELGLFHDILDGRLKAVSGRLREIEDGLRPQENLFGEVQSGQMELDRVSLERERERLKAEQDQVARAKEALQTVKDVPFVWDIAFVDVFDSERRGFDIVIGNPPYVRQESIHDPHKPSDEVTKADKRAYKDKLARSVYTAWPRSFGYDWASDKARRRIYARSDLYIYFYLHGLSLLNDKGSFCFITSSSWLDVAYGKGLQEFLLTRGEVKLIVDNRVRRSFSSADVNTVIVLLGPPQDSRRKRSASLQHTARFVMLSVPFEQVLSPVIWEEVEEATTRCSTPEYRVFPQKQGDLLQSGMDPKKGRFVGDKWGGKYLRAPDIYWAVMEKARDKLVRLGDIADVRFGIKTGANDFFYVEETDVPAPEGLIHVRNGTGWEGYLEADFLEPVIKSLRELKTVHVDPENLRYLVFMCHRSKKQLIRENKKHALDYIDIGEDMGYHQRSTCGGRPRWWDLGRREGTPVVVPAKIGERYLVPFNAQRFLVDKTLYDASPRKGVEGRLVAGLLNWQFTRLNIDVTCRQLTGAQAIADVDVNVWEDANLLNPSVLTRSQRGRLLAAFEQMAKREIKGIFEELGLPEANRDYSNIDSSDVSLTETVSARRTLDGVVFEALGLTEKEQVAVYQALVDLVKNRLAKARSV
ncbi:MAG: Eco57I restriction-modification methylase domain-containing protein [bacterium]